MTTVRAVASLRRRAGGRETATDDVDDRPLGT
jgi:hypothetical protein